MFEIDPIDMDGELNGELFREEDRGDDVLGHLTMAQVLEYVEYFANLEQEKE